MSKPDPSVLPLSRLQAAVKEDSAIRNKTRLIPTGAPEDKVFPSSYINDNGAKTRYAFEDRRIEGCTKKTVLLNSVAAEANARETALQDAIDEGLVEVPHIEVDFSETPEAQNGFSRLTSLEVPHRAADAIFRDSVLNGVLFRATEAGRALESASPRNTTPLYLLDPVSAMDGLWDTAGKKGGLGNKFPRRIVSEIIGVNAIAGKAIASRLDPLGIRAGVPVYQEAGENKGPKDWVADPTKAKTDKKGKPLLIIGAEAKGKGKPSAIVHGNIAPSIVTEVGGVTLDYAQQITVVSMTGFRALRFPTDTAGNVLSGKALSEGQAAARTVLAALALLTIVLRRRNGFQLRSRCHLIPTDSLVFDILGEHLGVPVEQYALTADEAIDLFEQAVAAATAVGFGWDTKPLVLKPSVKLVNLVDWSHQLDAEASGADEA